jgi:hypothetical protein
MNRRGADDAAGMAPGDDVVDFLLERQRRQLDLYRDDLKHIENNTLTLLGLCVFLFAATGAAYTLLARLQTTGWSIGAPLLAAMVGVTGSTAWLIYVRFSRPPEDTFDEKPEGATAVASTSDPDPLPLRRRVLEETARLTLAAGTEVKRKETHLRRSAYSLFASGVLLAFAALITAAEVRHFEKAGGRDWQTAQRLVGAELLVDGVFLNTLAEAERFPTAEERDSIAGTESFLVSEAWKEQRPALARYAEGYVWSQLVKAYLRIGFAKQTYLDGEPEASYTANVREEFREACAEVERARLYLHGSLRKEDLLGCEQFAEAERE